MLERNRRFQASLAVGVLLLAGLIAGVVLSARLGSTPGANGGEPAASVPLPLAAGVSTPNFVPVAKAVTPAVVNVSTTRVVRTDENQAAPFLNDPLFRRFFGEEFFRRFQIPRERRESSLGSGVIVSNDGYIVTNPHVVAKADEIRVLLNDKREFNAKVVGTDSMTDIAVLKIDAEDLPSLPWGDSDRLDVGEYILAIGNPFALNSTVTMGIVSAVGRAVRRHQYRDLLPQRRLHGHRLRRAGEHGARCYG